MRILKVEPSGRVKGRFLVHLEDGSLLRVSESELVAFALCSGMELEDEAREKLVSAAAYSAAKNRALSLLSSRPLSRRELVKRLCRQEEPEERAEQVADWLEEMGFLNDAEYAKSVVRHYRAKGYGAYKIRDELYRRGVPREYWEEALLEAEDSSEVIDALIRKKLTAKQPDRRELKKVSDALARRGYSWSEIGEALRRFGADTED